MSEIHSTFPDNIEFNVKRNNSSLRKSGGIMTGALSMGTNKITSLGTPTGNTDAATKSYVDTAITNSDITISTAAVTANSIVVGGVSNGVTYTTGKTYLITFTFANTSGGAVSGVVSDGASVLTTQSIPDNETISFSLIHTATANNITIGNTGLTRSYRIVQLN